MTSELGRRIWFTIGALLVYRVGTYIPLPGIDQTALAQLFRSQAGGLFGYMGLLSGGGVQRLAIFALGLMPYLTAAILLQLLSVVGTLKTLSKQGEAGRRTLDAYTLALTILFAAFQGYGMAVALEGVPSLVADPGWPFRLTTVASLTGGTLFLVWLSGQITTRGLGNGLALILFVGIVAELPGAVAAVLELGRRGVLSSELILGLLALAVAVTALVVAMEVARRRLPILYRRRQIGLRLLDGRSELAVKLNAAGVIPAIFASWLLAVVSVSLIWWTDIAFELEPGRPLYLILYAIAIVLGAFLYTAFLLDPERLAADLDRHGGIVGGVTPGVATVAYLDAAISRTTMLGAAYLAFVCLIPELLVAYAQVPFYLGGMSLLIVVCTVLDLDAQLKNGALTMGGGQRP